MHPRVTAMVFFIFFSSIFSNSYSQSNPPAHPAAHAKTTDAPKQALNIYEAVDKKALLIPDSSTHTSRGIADYIGRHFDRDNDKARAAFIWIATNVRYDLDNMFALNFYEKKEDKISRTLKTRKGICEDYATLFTDICSRVGLHSFVVEGYTKQNGFADYIPHAWSAASIDSSWFLFDPTWGSGNVNNGKFYSRINNDEFKADPAIFIRTHMPFDYLWQFLYYPVTNAEFYSGNTLPNKSKPVFNFPDSIRAYEKQNELEYFTAAAGRIERNGVKNGMIFERLQYFKREIDYENGQLEVELQNRMVTMYNSAIVDYNDGVNDFNDYIRYRNKQFTPVKPDADIKAMLDTVEHTLQQVNTQIGQIHTTDSSKLSLINSLQKQVNSLSVRVNEEQEWLKKYFAKGKSGRKAMFTKTTWFGIPLN
jgi:hypothetical protein